MDKIRIALVICLMFIYLLLGFVDIKNHNVATGISAFLLVIVTGLLFFAGAK